MKKIILSFVVMLLVAFESQATTSVAGSPSTVSNFANAPVSITWSVVGNGGFHSSSEGLFTNPATGLPISAADIGTTLTIQCIIGASSITCVPVSETFLIPASVIAGAQALGVTTINYSRVFTDGIPATGIVKINLLSTTSPVVNPESTLKITRESLHFSDNSTHKLINQGTNISVIADLKYSGSGLFDAFWEYTSPLSTTGAPVYTPLSTVRRYLGIGGRVVLQSPSLPTNVTGQYVVRLRILKTATNPNGVEFTNNLPDGLPIIRYTVMKPEDDKNKNSLPSIKTNTPYDNTVLKQDTRFNWQAVDGAHAYQLELYLVTAQPTYEADLTTLRVDETVLENRKPVAGLLIPANETSLSLSALARNMLKQQQSYYWRIIAIGEYGQTLATSPIKTIRIQ